MDLHKIQLPDNFAFSSALTEKKEGKLYEGKILTEALSFSIDDLGEDVFRVEVRGKKRGAADSVAELTKKFAAPSKSKLTLGKRGEFRLESGKKTILSGPAAGSFGTNGSAWLWRFYPEKDERFFGMGEKWGPLEKSGQKSIFWNTDVWGDFAPSEIAEAKIDSAYATIPYLVIRRGSTYLGLFLDCPYPSFMATNPVLSITGEDVSSGYGADTPIKGAKPSGSLYLGANDGAPILYVLVGPTLLELTKKFARLVGTTPRPPLWALGHQQSRWGYGSLADLESLDEGFRKHEIPCDGLWLDIDYMDGYRVFTLDEKAFSSRGKTKVPGLAKLRASGRKIVPILDPGVKVDPGYPIYDEALRDGHFCLAPSGRPYVGIVWPGTTCFPDFSAERTAEFWSENVARFVERGFDAFWVDMNDPSTGPVENRSMLFAGGKKPHEAFHNQYGHAMARATHLGLKKARPNERPFVLTRSAYTSSGRFAAVWTGDNISSFRHLAASLPVSMNLALSGIPWNGPDVPGFGGDASNELAERWYQAACLFPFFRNHAVKGCRAQEPWAFPKSTREVIARYARLRYRFLPYLYQLFVEHEKNGAPLLAPMFLHTETDDGSLDLEDQYFMGANLFVAPLVNEGASREITIPGGAWVCLRSGKTLLGPKKIKEKIGRDELAVYVRSGSVFPLLRETAIKKLAKENLDPATRLREIDFYVFGDGPGEFDYVFDDGISFDYQRGDEHRVRVVWDEKGGNLEGEPELLAGAKIYRSRTRKGATKGHSTTLFGAPLYFDEIGRMNATGTRANQLARRR